MSYADPARAPADHRRGQDAPQEAVGQVASDSLAADSLKSGGDFADGDAVASSVKGASSTFANTDTSGATPLHPAASGAVREKEDESGLGSDEKGPGGLKYPDAEGAQQFSGTTTSEGYSGGPSADKASEGYSTQQAGASDFGASTLGSGERQGGSGSQIKSGDGVSEGSDQIKSSANTDEVPGSVETGGASSGGASGGAGVRPYVESAPNYAAKTSGAIEDEGYGKPKGENLKEGDIPETKTFTGDVGGPHDPGRVAELGFEKANADTAATGAARDMGSGGENPYDSLNPSERT